MAQPQGPGHDLPLPSRAATRRHRWTGAEAERAEFNHRTLVVGTPERVRDALTRLASDHGVGEIVVNTLTHDPEDRLRSHQLLAEAFALTDRSDALATATKWPSDLAFAFKDATTPSPSPCSAPADSAPTYLVVKPHNPPMEATGEPVLVQILERCSSS